jgi:hypothetical protein
MTAITAEPMTGRSLVTDELFDRLTAQVVKDGGHDPAMAARVVDQSMAFVATCAVNRSAPLSPSKMVDPGWHAFILHTRDYRAFCRRIAGRFIDHVPTGDVPGESGAELHRTVAAIRAARYIVDDELWYVSDNASCTGCVNGCHDDPPPTA